MKIIDCSKKPYKSPIETLYKPFIELSYRFRSETVWVPKVATL